MDPPTSDDFKAWRILYRQTAVPAGPSDMDRRVARERRLRQRETAQTRRDQDDEYMFDDESYASAPLNASGRASPRLDIPPGLYISDGATIVSSTSRFILVVTASLVKANLAPVGQAGTIFGIHAILPGQLIQAILPSNVRRRTPDFVLTFPCSELWRCIVTEAELPRGFVPPVGRNLHFWIHLSADDIAARIIVRRQLAELYLAGKAGGLLLCSPPGEMPIPPNTSDASTCFTLLLRSPPESPLTGASPSAPSLTLRTLVQPDSGVAGA